MERFDPGSQATTTWSIQVASAAGPGTLVFTSFAPDRPVVEKAGKTRIVERLDEVENPFSAAVWLLHAGSLEPACRPDDPLVRLLHETQAYLRAMRSNECPPARLQQGWERFYALYDPLVRRTIAACRVGRDDLDDCVQEAWAELAVKLAGLNCDPSRGSFESWLKTLVRRKALLHHRRRLRGPRVRTGGDLPAIACPRTPGPSTATEQRDLCRAVRRTLAAFRPLVSKLSFRILVLASLRGESLAEIAERLSITPGHARVCQHRTLQRFRQFLESNRGILGEFSKISGKSPDSV